MGPAVGVNLRWPTAAALCPKAQTKHLKYETFKRLHHKCSITMSEYSIKFNQHNAKHIAKAM